jgi:hypothetical protein
LLAKALYVYVPQEDSMSHNDIVMQVKEFLERNLDSSEISSRMNMDIQFVESIIRQLKIAR